MSDNKFDLIDDYLENNLSKNDHQAFEQALESDTNLQNEVHLQKDVINSLQNIRRAELKARLNSLPVSSGLTTFQKFGIAAITLSGTALLTLGLLETNETSTTPQEEINVVKTQVVQKTTPEPILEDETITLKEKKAQETPVATEENKPENETITKASNETLSLGAPDPMGFDMDGGDIVEHNTNSTAPTNGFHGEEKSKAAKYNTEVIQSSKKFLYEYDGENLKLVGDFDKKTYTVIEDSKNGETSLFLKFESKFYRIKETKKATKLEAITNPAVIKELSKK